MKRLLTGLILAAALVGTATAAQPGRVLAVEWQAGGGKLRWVSPKTLRPVGAATLNVGGAPADIAAVSPDGAVAAIGGGAKGRLRFVRLATLRQESLLWLGEGSVLKAAWASSSRLVVLLGGARPEVVVVDPVAHRVLRREPLAGTAMGGVAVTGGRVLTLLARRDGIGPVQLAVIGGNGSVRTVAIPSIAAGVTAPSTPTGVVHFASPGLAARGSRAVVVGPESLVEVDLETLAIREQRLDTRTTARASKIVVGWGRSAVWLQSGTIAYTGWSIDDAHTRTTTGVHVAVVDTGATQLLDARATAIQRAGSTLLVHGDGPLRAFRLDGTPRYELLRGTDTGYVQVAGEYAYVGSGNSTRFGVVDLRSGRIVGLARTAKPTVVLAP